MKSTTFRKNLLAVAIAGVFSMPVMAQDQQESTADDQQAEKVAERIQVTGSRIPQSSNVVSSSPISQVTSEEFEFSGNVRTEDLVNDLPQVFPGQTSTDSNGATGTATISLRGLGSNRTLVLMNGRRLVMGSPLQGAIAPDLNQIPGALVENVELLTGGASATYGSDAVAGVVNFIMKDDFEGVKLDYQHSFYQYNNPNSNDVAQSARDANFDLAPGSGRDGHMNDFSIIWGVNADNGKGNITGYATYRDIKAVTQDNRDYSICSLAGGPGDYSCGGSGTIPDGRLTDFVDYDYYIDQGTFQEYDGRLYNFGPRNYFQRPDERVTLGAFGHYEINKNMEFFGEVGFVKDRSVSQIAESGAFFPQVDLSCDNPFLSPQQASVLCGPGGPATVSGDPNVWEGVYIGKRNVEGGPRQNDIQHLSYRGVFGIRGYLNDTWSYDVSANFGNVTLSSTYLNDFSITNIGRALNVTTDPDTGEAVCSAALSGVDPNCVPWNIFAPNITQDALDYLTLPLYANGETNLREYTAYVIGNLGDYGIRSPYAVGGVELLLGATTRSEELVFQPDSGFTSGDGAGQGGPTIGVSGSLSVDEIFSEAKIYLVEGADWADTLTMDLGYRYSEYSTAKETDTYKLALGWDINEMWKVRGSFQRSARHANIRELYQAQSIGLYDMDSDPCGGADPEATLEECQRTGVTSAQYGNIPQSPANQYNSISGGNPDLEPETSDTISVGFVYRTMEGDFDVSLDYFDIKVEDAIGIVAAETTLDLCLDTGDAQFCDLINRGPETGSLWLGQDNIIATNVNIGFEQRSGFDLNSSYTIRFDNDFGKLKFNLVGTYFTKFDTQPVVGLRVYECAGYWGGVCGAPNPEWQHNLRATWENNDGLAVSANWRYLGETQQLDSGPQDIDAENYLDLTARYRWGDNTTISVGVNNVLENDPPYLTGAPGSNGNTYPGYFDALGRYVFASISYQFM